MLCNFFKWLRKTIFEKSPCDGITSNTLSRALESDSEWANN